MQVSHSFVASLKQSVYTELKRAAAWDLTPSHRPIPNILSNGTHYANDNSHAKTNFL